MPPTIRSLVTVLKPAGIPVLRPHDDPEGDCVLARLLAAEPGRATVPWAEGFEGGVAHRLDISTSGAVVVARNPQELGQIRAWFGDGAFTKTYRFMARHDVLWSTHACDRPLAHDRRHRGRMVVQRGRNTPHRGRWLPAQTCFRRVRGPLWEATMHTGVMHQIRVHAAFVGLALRGDRLYGGGPTPPDAPAGVTFFLHHLGLAGPGGVRSGPVPTPPWASDPRT